MKFIKIFLLASIISTSQANPMWQKSAIVASVIAFSYLVKYKVFSIKNNQQTNKCRTLKKHFQYLPKK